jgi:hypothetical protein
MPIEDTCGELYSCNKIDIYKYIQSMLKYYCLWSKCKYWERWNSSWWSYAPDWWAMIGSAQWTALNWTPRKITAFNTFTNITRWLRSKPQNKKTPYHQTSSRIHIFSSEHLTLSLLTYLAPSFINYRFAFVSISTYSVSNEVLTYIIYTYFITRYFTTYIFCTHHCT